MKKLTPFVRVPMTAGLIATGAWLIATGTVAPAAPDITGRSLRFGRFGPLAIVTRAEHPSEVVLFVSGDGGWNKGVVDMVGELAGLDALVVGIDIRRYLQSLASSKNSCSYFAGDFEGLSQYVQKQLGFPRCVPPILVGYSSGATLVYAVLVQGPVGTFKGAVSLGFCPDLMIAKPPCKGDGLSWKPGPKNKGILFDPAPRMGSPWVALQGTVDQVCSPPDTESYVKQVPGGDIVMLPKLGHGFSVPTHWMPQFKEAFRRIARYSPQEGPEAVPPIARGPAASDPTGTAPAIVPPAADPGVEGLPLVEVPAVKPSGSILAILITGDGGWAGLDREVSGVLSSRGIPVVGLNSLQYFWHERTPDELGGDLARIARHYLALWKREKLLLIGYSRGADLLPFGASRLPADLREKVRLVALLGPSTSAAFEIRLSDFLGGGAPGIPILPEARKLAGLNLICVHGAKEKDTLCTSLPDGLAVDVPLKGGHHFGGDYEGIAERILQELK